MYKISVHVLQLRTLYHECPVQAQYIYLQLSSSSLKTKLVSYKFHTIRMIRNHTTMICPQNTMIPIVTWQLPSSNTESDSTNIRFIFNKLSLQYIKEGQPHYINRHFLMIWDQHYSKQSMFSQCYATNYVTKKKVKYTIQ